MFVKVIQVSEITTNKIFCADVHVCLLGCVFTCVCMYYMCMPGCPPIDQVFGCRLEMLCEREKNTVPRFVRLCTEAVEKRGRVITHLGSRPVQNTPNLEKICDRCQVEMDPNGRKLSHTLLKNDAPKKYLIHNKICVLTTRAWKILFWWIKYFLGAFL